ncbi:MAG: 50S ribosomal protein L11 methyltransferase [Chitinophagaceae bacterium]|nr:50S ribosomal protein L11 methyltransferase [Oligoflexus sp.]
MNTPHSRIYELSLWPGKMRRELQTFLESIGVTDYVEAATDAVNADDVDWESVYADWAERDDAPLVIYRVDKAECDVLVEVLTEQFGKTLTSSGKWIADDLWQEAWEPDFRSLETERFFIGPLDVEPTPGKVSLVLAAAAVFGSGQHATTQALVRLMEKETSGAGRFLDVGTGTGVLAFVANFLGYTELLGTDIEDTAIANAAENAARNHIPLNLMLGSLPSFDTKWDTIACNILPPTLTDLLASLKALLKKDGVLYLAGFNQANQDKVSDELDRLGLIIVEEERMRGWLGWKVKQKA